LKEIKNKQRNANKVYKILGVVHGILQEKKGMISSFLAENTCYCVYSVNDPTKGKFAQTAYQVIKESEKYSLLEIKLFTGRKHQIRVHLAEKGHPVAGDKVYGKSDACAKRMALHSALLKIVHPFTKRSWFFKPIFLPGFTPW
jgi:23S rRNA pseudouridine1911/1915/1917 synthase